MIPIRPKRSNLPFAQYGFSLIEVLVTLLIMSLALLGTAGLQAYSMRLNQGSQFRTQAVFLAADLAERIEANKTANYTVSGSGPFGIGASNPVNCVTATCSSANLAAYDLWEWQRWVGDPTVLPQSSWTVTRVTAGTLYTYTIVVSWVDRLNSPTTAYAPSGAASSVLNATSTGEQFSYTTTRSVSTIP